MGVNGDLLQKLAGMRDDRAVRNFSYIRFVILVGFALGICGASVTAQSTEADISARIIGKPLLLKGFWLDNTLEFDQTGQPVKKYRTGSFTESAFDAKHVTLRGNILLIEGQRVVLEFDRQQELHRVPLMTDKMFHKSPVGVAIKIDGGGNADFSDELNAIFTERLVDLAPLVPECWHPFEKWHFVDPSNLSNHPADSTRGVSSDQQNNKAIHVGETVKPPRVVTTVDPRFPELAKDAKFSGDVLVYMWVGEDGMPSHIRVARPVGFGLDEQAIAAASQYRFKPATRDGKPVKVDLYIDVNFQIF